MHFYSLVPSSHFRIHVYPFDKLFGLGTRLAVCFALGLLKGGEEIFGAGFVGSVCNRYSMRPMQYTGTSMRAKPRGRVAMYIA